MNRKPTSPQQARQRSKWITPRRVGEALLAALLLSVHPAQLARAIKGLFRSPARRKQEAEMRREVQVRMGQTHIRRLLARQRALEKRLLGLAKRALALGDEARFRQLGQQVLAVRRNIRQWEQHLITLEMLAARREQARTTAEMIAALQAISASLSATAESQQDLQAIQAQLNHSLAQAEAMEARAAQLLETADAALMEQTSAEDAAALDDLQAALSAEIAAEETRAFDPELEADLQRLRAELEGTGR